MPKKYPDSEKREWLDLYEKGKTERWITKEFAHCDMRTLKNGIEEARRKRDIVTARVDLLKEALRKHQDTLLEDLERISSSLVMPSYDFVPLAWSGNDYSIFTYLETFKKGLPVADIQKPTGETLAVRKLLKEHLKNDRLWKVISKWGKAYADQITARMGLQLKEVSFLEQKTKCKMTYQDNVLPPIIVSYTTGDIFYKAVLQGAFDAEKGYDLERDIHVDINSHEVRFQNSTLAKGNGNEQEIMDNLLKVFKELKKLPEVTLVIETFKALEEITEKGKEVIEKIGLLGLIPGQCEICRRLGM